MGERSFAGYAYHQRLAAGPFGDVFRALGGSGQEARIVHVQQRLADLPSFTTALYRFGREMSALDHPRVVAIRHVGNSGTDVAVLTDSVSGPVPADSIQERAEGPLPRDVAMAIAVGAIEGLSHAHSLGVVHGAVHPRSVLVDFHGGVKLADFGLAWALAAAAVAGKNPALYAGLRGFVAPEMALGQVPTERSDVFAAGALLGCLWSGQAPSGAAAAMSGDAPPRLIHLVERMLAVDPLARPVNGTEVEEMLEEVITAAGIRVAPPDEVAAFVSRLLAEPRARRESADGLGAATSDLIAELEAPMPARRAVSDVIAGLEAEAEARGAGGGTARFRPGIQVTPAPVLRRTREPAPRSDYDSGAVTAFDGDPHHAEVSQVGDSEHTDVDAQSMLLGADPDPISAILKLSDSGRVAAPAPLEDSTPLPEPSPDQPGTVTRHIQALEREQQAEQVRARGRQRHKFGSSDAVDSLAETLPDGANVKDLPTPVPPASLPGGTFPGPVPPAPRRPSTVSGAGMRPSSEVSGIPGPYEDWGRPRRKRIFFWLALTVFALSALGAFLYTQTDLFDPGRRAAADRAADRADEEALAAHQAAQVKPVDLTITSAEPDAAVWLLLGRTPFESMSLSSGMVHELRFEHEGYLPLDLRVTGYEWKGDDKQARRAEVNATLVAGEPKGPVPAVGPEPASPPPPGPSGRGVLAVKSTPAGAQVWLLIGFTPRATITGLPAGRDVEVKVLKNGFLPGFAAIKGDAWYLSGPGGPVQPSMQRDVALTRAKAPAPAGKKSPKRGK